MRGPPISINDRFGTFVVIDKEVTRKKGPQKTWWVIRCDCGNVTKREASRLREGFSCRRCGVNRIVGTKNHKANFLEHIYGGLFKIRCDCGVQYEDFARSKSCGCHVLDGRMEKAKRWVGFKSCMIRLTKFLRFDNRSSPNDKRQQAIFQAKCKCGKVFEVGQRRIRTTYSCGCTHSKNMAKGQNQGSAKLSDLQVKTALDLYLTGTYDRDQVCVMTGVPLHTLNDVIGNKSWKHIEPDRDVLANSPHKQKFRNRKRPTILPGNQYGSWTVIDKAEIRFCQKYWNCVCKCGSLGKVPSYSLSSGKSKQCARCSLSSFIQKRRNRAVSHKLKEC